MVGNHSRGLASSAMMSKISLFPTTITANSSYLASCDDLPRKYGLPPGSLFHYVGYDEGQSQRSVTTYHEVGVISSDKEVMLRELLVHIASPEAFNILRTKEQLGYGAGVISVVDSRSHG